MYPFPATLMRPDKIYHTQLAVTSLFLNKIGFHCHMPHAVIYALASVGGLDFHHLSRKQGVQQVLQLTKHLWANTTNGQSYHNLIDAHQVHAGVLQPILQYTRPLPWSPAGWLATICNFLHSTSTKIILDQPWTPPHRHHDRNIMDDALQHLPNANLKAINNVHLYLQVCYLSEITDTNGSSSPTRYYKMSHGNNQINNTIALSANTHTGSMETMVLGHTYALHPTQQCPTTATAYHMAAAGDE